ncbi:xylulokinase [Gracilinema caldarium]|uniref:Xylulokinase n=1 Tax=Gracilinema caldarium (strain ATCC 51460 / DSM 7334 / H1) TaxID=744872 RepID=F8EY62_GRAC1|nr:FGGY family carbohydrate kinase [Gracilinema caldarium]AEJ18221.1 Xylulokinase [Gracilinema caldarium DSM 7334]
MVLGIDLGTGSIKILLQDINGTIRCSTSATYPVNSPEPGAAETNPECWLSALKEAIEQVQHQNIAQGFHELKIDAIGFSGQMHGIIPLSEKGEILHSAILWADGRGSEFIPILEQYIKGREAEIMNSPNAGMSAISILWLKKYRPEVYNKARWFVFPKDFIRYQLTGHIATDFSDASGSLLYNFKTHNWDQNLCKLLQIDEEKLPPIYNSLEVIGYTTAQALQYGLPDQIPVVTGAGDTPAALFGSACFINKSSPSNIIQISVGTGIQVVRPLSSIPPFNPTLNFYESVLSGQSYHMAGMLNGGLALEHVREWLNINWDEFYKEFDKNPSKIPQDLVFLPYLAGERTPYRNPNARGSWIGLSLQHTRQDLMASALFGVACTVRLGVETLLHSYNTLKPNHFSFRLVGGSSRRSGWVRLLASVLEHSLQILTISDTSAKGAAAMARTTVYKSMPEQPQFHEIQPIELPELEQLYKSFLENYQKLYPAKYPHT